MTRSSSLLENRALVTGGSGFLGSHLCDRLLGRGQDVLCVDNLFTGQKRNVAHLHGNAAQVSVEIGRGQVPTESQPTFAQLEEALNTVTI